MQHYLYPARMFNKVDFPDPDGPSIAVNSPDLKCPRIPFSITFVPTTHEWKIILLFRKKINQSIQNVQIFPGIKCVPTELL